MNLFKLTLLVIITLIITSLISVIYFTIKVLHFVLDDVLLTNLESFSKYINGYARILMRRVEAK